jgi:NAD(P)H dehydrogenase (quinone)
MKVAQVVYSHPEPRSFVAAMRDVVVAGLRECDWNVTVSDLHTQQFTAVASA